MKKTTQQEKEQQEKKARERERRSIEDYEYLKSDYKLVFTAYGNDDGCYSVRRANLDGVDYCVKKGKDENEEGAFIKEKRDNKGEVYFEKEYTLKRYYDCHLENWCNEIDNANLIEEKLVIINNAILEYEKDKYDTDHPYLIKLLNKNIEYLKACVKHSSNFIANTTRRTKKRPPLVSYISNIENPIAFIEGLKIIIEGFSQVKMFGLLIYELKKKQIINIEDGRVKAFHSVAKEKFGENVGGDKHLRNILNDKNGSSKSDIELIESKLAPLLEKYSKYLKHSS